jgi:hypothetical protein
MSLIVLGRQKLSSGFNSRRLHFDDYCLALTGDQALSGCMDRSGRDFMTVYYETRPFEPDE